MTDDQIKDFVEQKKDIMRQMLMEEIMDDLSTDKVKVLYAFIALNPKSSQYGDMLGAFAYKDIVCVFRFHVHRPKQKHPSLSNHMVNCSTVEAKTVRGITFYEDYQTECPGIKAFWKNTPDSCLDDDSLAIRQFERRIIEYSRRKNFCGLLRKTDKQRLEHERRLD